MLRLINELGARLNVVFLGSQVQRVYIPSAPKARQRKFLNPILTEPPLFTAQPDRAALSILLNRGSMVKIGFKNLPCLAFGAEGIYTLCTWDPSNTTLSLAPSSLISLSIFKCDLYTRQKCAVVINPDLACTSLSQRFAEALIGSLSPSCIVDCCIDVALAVLHLLACCSTVFGDAQQCLVTLNSVW